MRKISFLHTIIPVTPEKIIDTFFVSCPTIKQFGMLNKRILPYHNTISALTNLSGKEDSEIILRHMTPWRENNRFCHKMPKLDYFSLAKLLAQKRRFSKRWIKGIIKHHRFYFSDWITWKPFEYGLNNNKRNSRSHNKHQRRLRKAEPHHHHHRHHIFIVSLLEFGLLGLVLASLAFWGKQWKCGGGGGGKTTEMWWRWWWWRENNRNVVAVVVEGKQ